MIGKLTRALTGRYLAKRWGYAPSTGMVAGLAAPLVVRLGGRLVHASVAAAADARNRRQGPTYGANRPASRSG
ncbi:hypothetical protein ETR14_20050 [Sphingosinicella sp. BN140058]|nr:hypothetical protein ETR14_20050 [Sphingosinicella sp. BN140058]